MRKAILTDDVLEDICKLLNIECDGEFVTGLNIQLRRGDPVQVDKEIIAIHKEVIDD